MLWFHLDRKHFITVRFGIDSVGLAMADCVLFMGNYFHRLVHFLCEFQSKFKVNT